VKIVLINGPKRSGKSTFAKLLYLHVRCEDDIIGFSYHLKRFVHGIYLGQKGFKLDPDVFDATKEDPQELLGGRSWRQMYIHYSENVIKPLHGKEWFGEQFIRSAVETGADAIYVPDSGSREEAEAVVRHFGAKNVLLIRIHRDGCVYDSTDSRGYIHLADLGVAECDIQNSDSDMTVLREKTSIVQNWIGDQTQ